MVIPAFQIRENMERYGCNNGVFFDSFETEKFETFPKLREENIFFLLFGIVLVRLKFHLEFRSIFERYESSI